MESYRGLRNWCSSLFYPEIRQTIRDLEKEERSPQLMTECIKIMFSHLHNDWNNRSSDYRFEEFIQTVEFIISHGGSQLSRQR